MSQIRVLAFYDYKGAAWWHRLHHLQRYLPPEITLDIREIYEDFPPEQYDFFMIFEAYLAPLLRHIPVNRIIAGSSCSRIASDADDELQKNKCLALVFNSLEMYKASASKHRIYCCQNGVDEQLFFPTTAKPQAFSACWIGNGNSICEKGLDIIKEACKQVNIPLLYRDQSRELQPLTQEEIRDNYYHKSSVYICASRWEGTPNPALEALACGIPVISTPVGNMPEILKNGYNGFIVERSADSIAKALLQLRSMNQDTLRFNARNSILNGWTWQQQAKKYAAMFYELATLCQLMPHRFEHASREGTLKVLLRESALSLSLAVRYTPLWRTTRHSIHALKKFIKRARTINMQ